MKKFGMIRRWRDCALGALLAVLSLNVEAFILQEAPVIDSYGGCKWTNNGNGTSTIEVVFNYKTITNNLGKWGDKIKPDSEFRGRGVILYKYDANGKLQPSSAIARDVKLNGRSYFNYFGGDNYTIYHGNRMGENILPEWSNKEPHAALIEVLIDNAVIKDWPGVNIRAANFTTGDDVAAIAGGVYVTAVSGASACKVVDPTVPPPKPPATLAVDVAAPDWNLGELPRGDDEKTLTGAEQEICFTYTGLAGGSRNFVINATSANGISGNRYLLRNTSKPSQTVPYDLTLDSGSATFRLPNASASPVRLNNNARTCFVPTFRTSVGMNADAGDYSDVLSFTVVTKS